MKFNQCSLSKYHNRNNMQKTVNSISALQTNLETMRDTLNNMACSLNSAVKEKTDIGDLTISDKFYELCVVEYTNVTNQLLDILESMKGMVKK